MAEMQLLALLALAGAVLAVLAFLKAHKWRCLADIHHEASGGDRRWKRQKG